MRTKSHQPSTENQPSDLHDLYFSRASRLGNEDPPVFDVPRMTTGFAQRSFMYTAPHIWITLPDDTIGNLHAYKSQLSHMNRCVSLNVLQTKVDAQSDKLSTVVGRTVTNDVPW